MKKVYLIENLDCANCAAKIEDKFNAHPQVQEATITFATKQLRLTADDPDALIPELTRIARTVEGGAVILPREKGRHSHHGHSHHEPHDCGCGHHHDEHQGCDCGHHHEGHQGCGCGHHHDEHQGCGCGHHHDEPHDCGCGHHHGHAHGHETAHDEAHHGHDESAVPLILGALLFAAGLLLGKLGWASFLVCLAGYVILGREVIGTALKNLTRGHVFDENFLMSIATIGAFFIGEYPEAVGVMLFYRVGEYFEHRAVARSRSQIMEALDLRPETVSLVIGEEIRVIPAEEAQVGDTLLVRPGDRIPLDGVVLSGESRIDTAPITGEPVPVRAAAGDSIVSGCVNLSGSLTIRTEKPLKDSMVTRILDSVENAAASKPKIDRFITRFARIYTPIVVAVALITAALPSLITGNWHYWVYTALSFLVMSCPCALVLSVPLAFFAGIGVAGKKSILFKGGQVMEAMTDIKALVFDKTGTLTRGDFRVTQVAGGHEVLALCAGCEQNSTHPIAQSIVACARERGMELPTPDSMEELAGRGIRARVGGSTVLCGSATLLREEGVAFEEITEYTGSLVYVAENGRFAGFIVISDTLKEGAREAIAALKGRDITPVMLTGDNPRSANAVAQALGIQEVHASLLPQEKLETMDALRSRYGAVMFVGDGINDAPVLAGANVGAAMGSGADAAIEAADVVFMTNDVGAVETSLTIARQATAIAWQNVVFALAVKAIVMVLGLLGHASMWLAVFADSGVAMLCVLNAIRLLYRK